MTDFAPPAFAVHLGGGAYLDASGKISFGAPSGVQIYKAPGGFRLDTKKLQEVFKDLSCILTGADDTKKKWIAWGVPEQTVKALGSIAQIAGIVGSALSIYTWAIGVLIIVMDLMSAEDGMSPELSKTLFGIKNQLRGIEQIQRADKMIEMHAEFDGRIDSMRALLMHLVVEKPVGAKRAQIFSDMQTIVDEVDVPLSRVRNQEWATTYDRDRYKLRGIAEFLPLYFEHSDRSLVWVLERSHNTLTMFDYRLGVPMLLYAATTYASLIQVAMPWFRSAGRYAGQLRKTADAIDHFVMRMQDESIARTEYTGQSILHEQDHPTLKGYWASPYDYSTGISVYPVGAFDLVSYDDSHPTTDLSFEGSLGLFHRNWHTVASDMNRNDVEAIADAANEQARQDYTNLQVVTGMFRLISTAAWLRFLSTPPDRSQTVSGAAADSRNIRDEAGTTATSPFIFPGGVIQHAATLKRYDARGRVRITTQEPGYVPAFNYRVVLRTINSHFSKESWADREYVGDIWHADYEPTQGDPRCNRLRTELRKGSILSEVVLFEGPSPSESKSDAGTATLEATTFDWYVPVLSPWSSYIDLQMPELFGRLAPGGREKVKLGTGGVSIHLTM